MDLLIKNGTVVTDSCMFKADVGVSEGKIVSLTTSSATTHAEKIIDATGKLVMPGLVDSHVHFRLQDMGQIITTDTFETGTRAAAFGGITTVIDFADQTRGESPTKAFQERKTVADKEVTIDYGLHVSLTDTDHLPELPKLVRDEGVSSFKMFTTYSWRNLFLNDHQIREVMLLLRTLGATAVVHCENEDFVRLEREMLVREGKTDPIYHAYSRPNFVEAEAIQRILLLAQTTGAKTHIFHVSTKEGVEAIRQAKLKSSFVTGETGPHYLLLTEDAFRQKDGYLTLMSPPLRKEDDQESLHSGLLDGTLDNVITDHCEFSRERKGGGTLPFHKVTNGTPGVETSLGLTHDLLINKLDSNYPTLVRLMSTNAARIFGLYPQKGNIMIGADADVVIFDPRKEFTITPEALHYAIDWNPYTGRTVVGWPETTILRGDIIVDGDSFLGKAGQGQYLHRSTSSAQQ